MPVPATTTNVEDGLRGLFREIGTTLIDVGKQGISTAGETVKTILAKKIMDSPEGQAEVAKYKMEYLLDYLPWFIMFLVLMFVGAKFVSRS